jgi:serine/threonine protein phosphatase PrpC
MFEFEHAGLTDVGMKRTHNEDNLYMYPERSLFLVADGMGGHASGEVASQIAVDTVAQFFMDQQDDEDITWPYKANTAYDFEGNLLVNAIRYANYCVYDKASKGAQYKGMGTTFVAMLFHEGQYYVGHVGDSRAYRVRNGEFVQLTEDHSLLNDYKKMAKLTPEEEKNFPHKNIIVRALGMKESVLVDLGVDAAQPGDLYLLCSDGLSGEIEDPELLQLALDHWDDPDKMVQAMVETANNNGGKDNVTVVVVKIM